MKTSMEKKEPIKNRDKQPTLYYTAGQTINIPGIGEFANLILRVKDETEDIQTYFKLPEFIGYDPQLQQPDEDVFDIEDRFKLAAITADFIYYSNDEADETGGVVMLTREIELVSDNFLAFNDLTELVEKNEGLLWVSDAVAYWQKEQYVKPDQLTDGIIEKLEQIDTEKLSDEERSIYNAYMYGGPVKYTKAEALMAVLSNDLDQDNYSNQLAAIMEMLESAEK